MKPNELIQKMKAEGVLEYALPVAEEIGMEIGRNAIFGEIWQFKELERRMYAKPSEQERPDDHSGA